MSFTRPYSLPADTSLFPASRRAGSLLTAAARAAGLHALALPNLHCGLVVDGGVTHALFDLARHGQEGLFDVAGVLGRRLEEGDA